MAFGRDTDGSRNSSVAKSHRATLRSLHAVTACLANNTGLPDLLIKLDALEHDKAVDSYEREFLAANDLLNERYFDESTLAFPSIPQHDGSIYASKPIRPSTHSSAPVHASTTTDGLATEAALTKPAESLDPMSAATLLEPIQPLENTDSDLKLTATDRREAAKVQVVSGPPGQLAPPSAEDEASFSAATKELLHLESPQKPAKVAHLPSQEVQEEALRERHEARDDARRRSDSDKASRPTHLQPQTELASSPSSTVGAYSMATPMPAQESPDTSPDSATAHDHVLPPEDLRPTSEELQEQEQHDRILAAQKDIARREAFGGTTPDDQLNWEAREAAAREEEERRAREDANGPEADARREMDVTEAEQVMEEVTSGSAMRLSDAQATSQEEKPTMPPSDADLNGAPVEPEDDDDNITVVARIRLPPLNTGRDSSATRAPPHMTTRVSSGTASQRSVSQTASVARATPNMGIQATSPPSISPVATTRRSGDDVEVQLPPQLRTPRRQARQLDFQTPHNASFAIEDLAPLRGAAEDQDRDYLEPLFRIQAHDSPNSQSKPLPELVKSAQKYLSTEDQFTTLHERMDYRILRRVYQLQNANKWSLRQMEKAKEPAPPVTHMDHMMAEMRWMRKDFKGERQMKKSVCAWMAARCADWVAADAETRKSMRIKVRTREAKASAPSEDQTLPDLEMSGESAPEDEMMPLTPTFGSSLPMNLVVAPELKSLVCKFQKAGKLGRALTSLSIVGLRASKEEARAKPLNEVSKFVEGKVLPRAGGPLRKRSRYDYHDNAEDNEDEPSAKRPRSDRDLEPEDQEVALFHPDNKHIRDRLHANNAFRPPSEFVMPATPFYEFRNGSQWVWEDDQKLRKLAKEYSFNWSLIADEMTLTSRYKSSADRRTPWECFERWVELETLPAEMRKTMYFKTWFQRLEHSQQAAERRYQNQVQLIQSAAQAQNGTQAHVPQRRRTVPSRVEKRKNTRYLWLVDAMRKNAKKRENNAYKQAEAQRAAAQRKSQNDNNVQQRTGPRMTPQEFSKKRQERDLQLAEAQRQHRLKLIEQQQRNLMQARMQPGGPAAQQRPGSSSTTQQHAQLQANGQPNVNMNGQLPQQARPPLPMATRNGHLAVPQVNAQGIPQAQMQPGSQMTSQQQQQQMARLAQVNAQRNAQYGGQQYQMPNGTMPSPAGNLTTAQQLQHNQALVAQMNAQTHSQNQATSLTNGHPMSASPSMPPPPTPHSQQQQPQQLSSGQVPVLMQIKNSLRVKHPHLSEDQLNSLATSELKQQSHNQTQSSSQARQNAMNAAAGIPTQSQQHPANMSQAYAHNQQAFQNNAQMANGNATYMNGGDSTASHQPSMVGGPNSSPQAAAAYANQMRQRQTQMMNRGMHSSPNSTHAQLHGSPSLAHVSPSMAPASPSVAYAGMGNQMAGARPPSRNNGAPGMPRIGSSNSVPMAGGMQSPHSGSSPRNMQASMAR